MIEGCEQVAYFVAGFEDNWHFDTDFIGDPAHFVTFGIICTNPLQNRWREENPKGHKRKFSPKLVIAYTIYTCFYG